MFSKSTQGFTLIEMLIAIVIIGIGLAGVLMAINGTVRASADPLVHKQMLAIAEEMLDEVLLKPFAVSGRAPVNKATTCGTTSPPSRTDFDDISDYNNYQTTGICDVEGSAVTGLQGYNVAVAVAVADEKNNLGTTKSGGAIEYSDSKQITVTVTRGDNRLVLSSWRTNYAK